MRRLLVEALRLLCEVDRAVDDLLSRVELRRKYYSTKGQDRWIVERALARQRNGYFVEVGAADGRTHSNTYILERDFGWTGIAIEADPSYCAALKRNRTCHCVHSCVDDEDRLVEFFHFGHMGGIVAPDTDNARTKRSALLANHADCIAHVQTRTLASILDEMNAPSLIDYLSIDVEGAENRILRSFPFHRFNFRTLTIERPTGQIHGMLKDAGFVLDKVHRYDGFYVCRELASTLGIEDRPFGGVTPKAF